MPYIVVGNEKNLTDYFPICHNFKSAHEDLCIECIARDAEGHGTIEQRFGLLMDMED